MSLACFSCQKEICKETCMKCREVLKYEIVQCLLGMDFEMTTHVENQKNLGLQTTITVSDKKIIYLSEDNRNKSGRPIKFKLDLNEVLQKYAEFGSYSKVAKLYGCSSTYIRNLINTKKCSQIILTDIQKKQILDIYSNYGSLRKSAAAYGCTHTHFKKLLDAISNQGDT